MPPRKNQPKKATAKAKPAPVKPTAKTEPAAAPAVVAPQAPKFTAGDLVRKALQLRQQHTLNAPAPTEAEVPKGPKPTIVEFKVILSDGTVLHAKASMPTSWCASATSARRSARPRAWLPTTDRPDPVHRRGVGGQERINRSCQTPVVGQFRACPALGRNSKIGVSPQRPPAPLPEWEGDLARTEKHSRREGRLGGVIRRIARDRCSVSVEAVCESRPIPGNPSLHLEGKFFRIIHHAGGGTMSLNLRVSLLRSSIPEEFHIDLQWHLARGAAENAGSCRQCRNGLLRDPVDVRNGARNRL